MLIVADNLGAWMCGCYGNEEIQTPNIDLLARTGTRFHNGYAAAPVGPAARATLHTGMTSSQHGVRAELRTESGEKPTQETRTPASFDGQTMISDLLSDNGWRCGLIGDWGFKADAAPGHGYDFAYTLADGSSPYRDPLVLFNGEQIAESGYLPELMTKAAGEFLDKQGANERFFLTLSYPGSLLPFGEHPQRYRELYAETPFDSIRYHPAAPKALLGAGLLEDPVASLRQVAAGVSALDAEVGALLSMLRDRKVWSNTLVVFTSDTGQLLGRHGLWGDGLGSEPVNMYEEVIRVPTILSWPGEIPVEAMRPEFVSAYDLLPTLLEACQIPASSPGNLCGRSCLERAKGSLSRDLDPWPTAVFASYESAAMIRDSRYKLVERNGGEGPNELYNVVADPLEARNEYGNAQFTVVRERLAERLAEWRTQYTS